MFQTALNKLTYNLTLTISFPQRGHQLSYPKRKTKWGRKLNETDILEFRDRCLRHEYNAQRDDAYKAAHLAKFGLTCHVKQYKHYTTANPNFRLNYTNSKANKTSEESFP